MVSKGAFWNDFWADTRKVKGKRDVDIWGKPSVHQVLVIVSATEILPFQDHMNTWFPFVYIPYLCICKLSGEYLQLCFQALPCFYKFVLKMKSFIWILALALVCRQAPVSKQYRCSLCYFMLVCGNLVIKLEKRDSEPASYLNFFSSLSTIYVD